MPPYEPRGLSTRYFVFVVSLQSAAREVSRTFAGRCWICGARRAGEFNDPVDAWKSMVEDPEKRARWQKARGKGGFRRTDWATVLEMMAAANIHTIKTHGPDRIAGFSPIPAMSMISYAAGSRMLQLMGGISLSFYDWYCDLPTASPEVWGEQTDVHESADWYNAKLLAVMGSNLNMTRTPGLPLRRRSSAQRHEDVGLRSRLQPGCQVRRRVGLDQRRAGRCVVDGRRPRALEGGAPRTADAVFHRLRQAVHRRAAARRDDADRG